MTDILPIEVLEVVVDVMVVKVVRCGVSQCAGDIPIGLAEG